MPLLFLLYKTNLLDILHDGVGIKIYADDMNLYFSQSIDDAVPSLRACLVFMTGLLPGNSKLLLTRQL